MEWRIFFPCLCEDDTSVIGEGHLVACKALLAELSSVPWGEAESRSDVYLATKAHFGLKARAGKKAELKVRTQRKELGGEYFQKYKLGKGDLASYSSEVCDKLQQYNVYQPGDEDIFKIPRFITVGKERVVDLRHGLKHEICRLVVTEEADSSLPANGRFWISVTLEESLIAKDIFGSMLHVYPSGHVMWKLLDFYIDLNEELLATGPIRFRELQHLYCPIVQGYPGFVGSVAGNFTVEDMLANLDVCREVAAFARSKASV